jgi:hypothetical protein
MVGADGALPPESIWLLLETAIIYEAERSPVTTQVSVPLLRSVAPDHCARMKMPGVAFTVTPAPARILVLPAPVCSI